MVFNQELLYKVKDNLHDSGDGPPLILNQDVFCNKYGSIRLVHVRKHFGLLSCEVGSSLNSNGMVTYLREKMMVQELTNQDLIDITDLYVDWRDTREVMPMRITYLEREMVDCSSYPIDVHELCGLSRNGFVYKDVLVRDVEKTRWSFRETIKRGNRPYVNQVKEKFKVFTEREPLMFFDESWGIKKTPMLYLTGGIDHDKLSRCEAWLHFGELWNSFITNLRNQYGRLVYIRAWQSQKNGYPHFHALIYFREHEFTVVEWVHPDGKQSWRLPSRGPDREKIKSAWKWGGLDIVCVQNTHDAFKDLLKYITRDLEGGESDLTNAMVWFFGKQSFSYSRDLIEAVWGKGDTPASLEPSDADLISAVSSNSNSQILKIEVFPIIRADLLDFDWENGADPPLKLVRELEDLADEHASITVRTKGSSMVRCDYCHEERPRRDVDIVLGVRVCKFCREEKEGCFDFDESEQKWKRRLKEECGNESRGGEEKDG